MITIITPVYNAAKYIRQCIESVADQQFAGIEHLVIDGASNDGTQQIVVEMMQQHPHLKLLSEKDRGQSDAMNKGIRLASNPVISFLNADDRYEPGALSKAQSFFKTARKDSFFLGDCRVLHEDGSEYMMNKPWPFSRVAFMLDFTFPFNPSAYFYHKSLHEKLGYYNEDDHLTMDIDFLLRLPGNAKIIYSGEILGNYVMLAGSKTMKEISAGRNIENLQKVFKEHFPDFTLGEKINYHFQKSLGKNRGWIMYYLRNPGILLKKISG